MLHVDQVRPKKIFRDRTEVMLDQSGTDQDLAIYSRTVVRQFSYVRRSYDIDTTPFAIHEARRTYDWRKYERKFASDIPAYVVRPASSAILLTVTDFNMY